MDNSPFFSILIPTYNRAAYLKECINNLLKQSFHDFEIIISDNNSDDDTPSVVEQYKDTRIRYVRQKENIGAVRNFLFLAGQALGKYIILHQDDDLLHKDFLNRCFHCVSVTPNITVYGAPLWRGDYQRGFVPTPIKEALLNAHPYYFLSDDILIYDGKESAVNFFYYYFINPPSVAICANTLREIGGFCIGTEGGGGDIITESRALLRGNLAFDPRPGGMHRHHPDNFCKVRTTKIRSEAIRAIFGQLIKDFEESNFDWQAVVSEHLIHLPWKRRFQHFRRWVRHQAPTPLQRIGWQACISDKPGRINALKIIARLGVRNAFCFLRNSR